MYALATFANAPAPWSSCRPWRTLCLTMTFSFEVMDSEKATYWRAINSRRLTVCGYDALAHTATQTIFQLMAFKQGYEKVHGKQDNAELARAYAKNLQDIESTLETPVSENFVASAIKVYTGILQHDELLKEVMLDEHLRGKAGYLQLGTMEEICWGPRFHSRW